MAVKNVATGERNKSALGRFQKSPLAITNEGRAAPASSYYANILRELLRIVALALWLLAYTQIPAAAQEFADPTIDAELKELRDRSQAVEIRESAARSLGRLNPPPPIAVSALSTVLLDKQEARLLRLAAVDALAAIGRESGASPEVVAALVKALDGRESPAQDSTIRAAAARALGKIPENDLDQSAEDGEASQAIPVLADAVTKPNEDPIVRANAAWALGQISGQEGNSEEKTKAVKALIGAVKLTPVTVGQAAAQSLIKMPKTAVPELEQTLIGNDDASFRWNIVWILGEIGDDAKDAVPLLTNLLKTGREDPNVRGAAAWALGKIGRLTKAGTADFPGTVSALIDALRNVDNDPNVRSNAAWALGRLGPDVRTEKQAQFPVAATSALVEALGDRDRDIRRNAAWTLGQVSPDPNTAAPVLAGLLNNIAEPDPRVRTEAALALGRIGPLGWQVQKTVQVLSSALKDPEPAVQMGAAVSLGQIGADARSVIAQLVDLARKRPNHKVRKEEEGVRWSAADAVLKIADALQMQGKTDAIEELEQAAVGLGKYEQRQYSAGVRSDAGKLRTLLWFNRLKGSLDWVQQHQVSLFLVVAYVLLWLLLYWKYPLLVFQLNEWMKPYAGRKLPQFLGGIPLSYLFLGGYFHYRPRVLDAWIAKHIGSARRNFQKKVTVQQRDVYVDLPLFFDGRAVSALGAVDLRSCFDKQAGYVLICGEGGSGKTSLACQICKWAMMDDETKRVGGHSMLALLLEQENFGAIDGKDAFIEVVRNELWCLIAPADAPSLELVERLLRSRRVVVTVDGFSEMNGITRSKIQPGQPEFAARALIITSRLEETLVGAEPIVVKPMRVQGDHLSTFMDAYLVNRNKKDLFSDAEYFDCLSKLSRIVGRREITVLLAKLYAEQMITAKEVPTGTLPENIPDLMLRYLNEVNRKIQQNRLDDRVVHRDARAIAWECLKETFRPMPARIERVMQHLNNETPAREKRLKYLEDTLRLLQTTGTGRDHVRFTLDPLAEYLAAMHVLVDFGEKRECWQKFLNVLDSTPGAPEAIRGFLLALCDCCTAKIADLQIPDFLIAELSRRAVVQRSDRNVTLVHELAVEKVALKA